MSRAIMNGLIEADQHAAEAALERLPIEQQAAILLGDSPTPGPWHVEEFERNGLIGLHVKTVDGAVIAEIFPQTHLVHVRPANAELIAAAPTMTDTIRSLRDDLASARNYIDLMHQAMDSLGVRDDVDQEMIAIEDEDLPIHQM